MDAKKEAARYSSLQEKKKLNLLHESQISLVLDSYEDIFSDFDFRPYLQRALSQDFVDECNRASRDKDDRGIELELLVPLHTRNTNKEVMIKKRLHDHFKKHYGVLKNEKRKILQQGGFFLLFGVIFMFFAAYILFYYTTDTFIKEFLVVMLEPGGWFLFWEGLDLMIFETKRINPDLEFHRKMQKVDIMFKSY